MFNSFRNCEYKLETLSDPREGADLISDKQTKYRPETLGRE
jgi:hypothetical protein